MSSFAPPSSSPLWFNELLTQLNNFDSIIVESNFPIEHLYPTFQEATLALETFASSQEVEGKIETVFGETVASGNNNHFQWPKILIVDSSLLSDALGGYIAQTNEILLSQSLITNHPYNSPIIRDIFLEEIGHAIDAQINSIDSPGDEGAIFSAFVQGKVLTPQALNQLQHEDDRATVVINGETVTIEQANFIVTDAEDSGAGSLRQALTEANNTPGADTITFDPSLSGQTITLTGEQLEITDSVTILGLGAEELTIDAAGNDRAFFVSDEETDNPLQVSIEGVTITGGSAVGPDDNTLTTDRFGGGIFNREILTLTDVAIKGNSAERDGGGIYNDRFGGILTVIDSLISENRTSDEFGDGGGISNGGTLNLNNTTLSNNTAGVGGGGIDNDVSGQITVNNSRIENNTAYAGGAINNDGVFAISSSTVANNVASNNGGGIHNAGSNEVGMTISRSTISGNSSLVGGGIDNANQLFITNSTVSSNSAETQGGGINNTNTLTLVSSTIAQNSTPSAGGLFNQPGGGFSAADPGELTLINSLIAGNDSQDLLNEIQEGFITRTGVINSNGVNLVADGSFTGENILNVDPLLSPLQDNGGSTLTHLLLEGSPAIDVGENTLISDEFDQRGEGFDRVVNGTIDLGAVEVDNTGLEPNTPPNAEDDEVSTIVGNSIIVNVLENDSDQDNDPLTVTIVTPPENGSAEVVGENNTQIAYFSDQDFSGTDTLVYEVSDGRTATDTATVTIQVEPIALDDAATTTVNREVAINVLANDRPINGEGLTLTFEETSVNGGEVTQDPQTNELIYTPPADFTGTDTFNYTISDGNFSSEAVVSIAVEEEVSFTPRNRVLLVPPPQSVAVNQFENNQFLTFFREETTLTLADNLTVEVSEPGTYNRPEQLNQRVIPAGTLVNSYLVHLDPVGDSEINLQGSITFPNEILGIIVTPSQLDATDEILGNPETVYPNSNSDRGLELDNSDRLEWDIEGRTLDLEFGDTTLDQIRVITAPPSPLRVTVVAPNEVDLFGEGEVTIFYNNTGSRELVAPLLNFEVEGGFLNLPDTNQIVQQTQLLGIDEEQPRFVLAPGEGGQLSLPFQAFDFPGEEIEDLEALPFPDTIQFQVNAPPSNDTIDWDANQEVLQPSFVSEAAWAQIYSNFTATVGETVGELTNVLVENFEHFNDIGVTTANAERLLNFELQQASDYGAIAQRYEMGSLGRGWSFIGDAQLSTDNEGNVALTNFSLSDLQQGIQNLDFNGLASFPISGALGITLTLEGAASNVSPQLVQIFERRANGSYQSQSGNNSTLTRENNQFRLEQPDGTLAVFDSSGRLNLIEDSNGNRLEATYNNGELTRLENTSGESLNFTYNDQGQITGITDEAGRSVTYGYDESGELLLSSTTPQGSTEFAYNENFALTTAVTPGNTSEFAYDPQGRLTASNQGGNNEPFTYEYDAAGGVTVTDGNNESLAVLLNDRAQIARLEDATGRTLDYTYNAQGNVTEIVTPDGNAFQFTYDNQGNLLTQTNPLNQEISYSYTSDFNRLARFTDPQGNGLTYNYDEQGNLVGIIAADGTEETFAVNEEGNVTATVNRRGQSTTVTYDDRDRVVRQESSDGSFKDFTYDNRGNLTAIETPQGTTTLTYDDADRVTEIVYDNGRSLSFAYNAAGARSRLSDQQGNVVNYSYDEAGRLTELSNGNGERIVAYSYDPVGRISREDNGNGTFTTYTYDASGQLTEIVNHAADGSVNSRYAYSYNLAGQRITAVTPDGEWTYQYDDIGQLIQADFNATNPEVSNQSLSYEYDAAGNRVRVGENGNTTDYTSNNRNQYTAAGNTTFEYDADGNLITKQTPQGTFSYSYNSNNQLISVSEPDGTLTEYEYDAFGNRVASIRNGERTEYLVDPFGLGNVVGEYDGNGNLTASYVHGLGLATRIDSSGNPAYYDTNAVGSTVAMTDGSGSMINRYAYQPFGENLLETETVANPFEFIGEFGVAEEENGLHFARSRYYDSDQGRFTSEDPLGITGGDFNLYRYALNNPVSLSDPTGENVGAVVVVGLVVLGGVLIYPQVTRLGEDLRATRDYDVINPDRLANDPNALKELSRRQQEALRESQVTAQGLKGTQDAISQADVNPFTKTVSEITNWFKDPIPDFIPDDGNDDDRNRDEDESDVDPSPDNDERKRGDSRGDPHLTTFDGLNYDFQAVGEFILTEAGEDFIIQVRQEPPLSGSELVSVNSAIAAQLGENRIGLTTPRSEETGIPW